ncbi:hypothetical protein Pvag_pPag30280 (plasmid) [Pantoea vagans C9-1]|nr:hypothetical protein Pvag_pPag30280 [Pantoea vagans C9-1]
MFRLLDTEVRIERLLHGSRDIITLFSEHEKPKSPL